MKLPNLVVREQLQDLGTSFAGCSVLIFFTTLWQLSAMPASVAAEQPEALYDFPAFTEGPVFDAEGNLFVSEPFAGRVTKISATGKQSLWLEHKLPNGHKVLPNGNHVLCVEGEILLLDRAGKVLKKLVTECDGAPLRAPNDLTLDRAGGFYFTDPGGSRERPIGTVHYVDANGAPRLVAGGLWVPNGLVLSPDGAFLYVLETVPNRVLRFAVLAEGKLGPVTVFAELPTRSGTTPEPDGVTIDTKGNLYVTQLGMTAIQVLDASGTVLRTLPAGDYDASNLVFGGPNRDELFITGSIGDRRNTPGRVYRLKLSGVTGVR